MGCLRVLVFVAGIAVLFPGACFLYFGLQKSSNNGAPSPVEVGIILLLVAVGLFWLTFKLRRPPGGEDPPQS